MGEMRDSDWSRPKILRSDWLGLIGAIMTTLIFNYFGNQIIAQFQTEVDWVQVGLFKQ